MQLLWIFSLLFALLIALFAVQNTATVSVNLLIWRLDEVAVAALVLAAAALGALITYLFGLSRDVRQRLALRGARSTSRDQDKLIEELRARVRELERDAAVGRPGPASESAPGALSGPTDSSNALPPGEASPADRARPPTSGP